MPDAPTSWPEAPDFAVTEERLDAAWRAVRRRRRRSAWRAGATLPVVLALAALIPRGGSSGSAQLEIVDRPVPSPQRDDGRPDSYVRPDEGNGIWSPPPATPTAAAPIDSQPRNADRVARMTSRPPSLPAAPAVPRVFTVAFDDARGDTHKTYTGQTAPDDAGDIVSVSFTLQRGDLIVRVQFAAAPTAQHDYYASGVYSRTDCWLELALDPDGSMPGYWTVCGGERSAFVAAGTVRIDGTALEITVPAGELPFTARPGDRLQSLNATSHLRAAYVPTVPAPTSNRADIAMTGVPLRLA